jgi:TPR repeat protein
MFEEKALFRTIQLRRGGGRLAAEQGHDNSQFNLGVAYANGRGVIQDNVYAHMWANLSAMNGDENGAGLRDRMAARMTPSQVEEAQTLARECVARNYRNC